MFSPRQVILSEADRGGDRNKGSAEAWLALQAFAEKHHSPRQIAKIAECVR